MNMITVVTVTIYSNDGCESLALDINLAINDKMNVNQVINEARNEALARYEQSIGSLSLAHRIIVHVDTFPEPQLRQTVIQSTLPEQPSDEPITSDIK